MPRQIPINTHKTEFRNITHKFEICDIGTSVSVKTIQEGMTERRVTKALSTAKKQNYDAPLTLPFHSNNNHFNYTTVTSFALS